MICERTILLCFKSPYMYSFCFRVIVIVLEDPMSHARTAQDVAGAREACHRDRLEP